VKRAPFPRSGTAQGVAALALHLRRRAKARADRQRLDGLLTQVCALRAERGCTEADIDQAAALFARSALTIARQAA